MNRIKAFFSGLLDTKASEFSTGWASIVMSILMAVPAAAPVLVILNWIAENIFRVPDAQALLGILIAYSLARMGKKFANAEPA